MKFLLTEEYDFKYIVNFTATPFEKQKHYLHNVIYRYGLSEAIADGVVKKVHYLAQGDASLKELDVETQQLELAIDQLKKLKGEFSRAQGDH